MSDGWQKHWQWKREKYNGRDENDSWHYCRTLISWAYTMSIRVFVMIFFFLYVPTQALFHRELTYHQRTAYSRHPCPARQHNWQLEASLISGCLVWPPVAKFVVESRHSDPCRTLKSMTRLHEAYINPRRCSCRLRHLKISSQIYMLRHLAVGEKEKRRGNS